MIVLRVLDLIRQKLRTRTFNDAQIISIVKTIKCAMTFKFSDTDRKMALGYLIQLLLCKQLVICATALRSIATLLVKFRSITNDTRIWSESLRKEHKLHPSAKLMISQFARENLKAKNANQWTFFLVSMGITPGPTHECDVHNRLSREIYEKRS